MILAIVISQVPMPEAQAEIVREMTEADMQVDDTSAHVVTFSMNGELFAEPTMDTAFRKKRPFLLLMTESPSTVFQMINLHLMRATRQSRIHGIQIRNV